MGVKRKKREAMITSLSLTLDQHGNPAMDRHKISIGSLKMYLEEQFPEYDHEQELINTCRWVDELLNEVQRTIEKEFNIKFSTKEFSSLNSFHEILKNVKKK